ncbi:MAG TPA: hypothetical protein VGI50_16830 [Solirubrobacteraceae bacterium]
MSKLLAVVVTAAIPVSAAAAKAAPHRHHHHHSSQHVLSAGANVLPPGATGVYCFNSPDTPPGYTGPPSICIPQLP